MTLFTKSRRNIEPPRPYFLLMIGRPGSGKGTQSILLANSLELAHVCTGDLLRDSRDPELRAIADTGTNLPQSLAVSLVVDRLALDDCRNGAVLDGCARTREQAKAIHEALIDSHRQLHAVVVLDLPEDLARQRILMRSLAEGKQRGDDHPEVISRRLFNFINETSGAIDYFERLGLVERVDTSGPAIAAHETIIRRLSSRLSRCQQ